jgi:hypothetical protein
MNDNNQVVPHAFEGNRQLAAGVNGGSVAIEQDRAIAEAQGQLVLAKRFPRNLVSANAELMDACKLPALANVAFYNVPRAGGSVSGPSIRLAEEIARCYGNFEYGHRELSRNGEKSEVEVYAWDKQNNNYSKRQLTVFHVRDTKNGPIKLRDQKDIDDKIANVASKQVRGRILALLPKWMVESAIEECRKTIAGNNDEPLSSRARKMAGAFARFGVSTGLLEKYLGHSLDEILADEIVELTGVYNSIREGTPPSDFFAQHQEAVGQAANDNDPLVQSVQKAAERPKPAPAPAAAPAKVERKAAAKPKPEPIPEPEQAPAVEPEQYDDAPMPEHMAEAPAAEAEANDGFF